MSDLQDEFEMLDDIYGDLPDGAYWAVMAEHGIEPEDLLVLEEDEDAE
jgi:hypothetical protein